MAFVENCTLNNTMYSNIDKKACKYNSIGGEIKLIGTLENSDGSCRLM